MEDTLRYFFSAVFQGFSAVVALGIMFYLYYLEKLRKILEDIESVLNGFRPSIGSDIDMYIRENGLVKYVKDKVLPVKVNMESYDFARRAVSMYENKIIQKNKLNNRLLSLFKVAVIIILTSLISLFSIGYTIWWNYALIIIGILTIVLSFIFFIKLYSFVKLIIEMP